MIDQRGDFRHIFGRHDVRTQRNGEFESRIRIAGFFKRFENVGKSLGVRLIVNFDETFFRLDIVFFQEQSRGFDPFGPERRILFSI